MAENITLARPYAVAVFELAMADKALSKWSEALELLAMVAEDKTMIGAIYNPRLGRENLCQLFIDVCGERLDDAGRNFVHLLSDYDRLGLLSDIAALYEVYRSDEEKVIQAQMTTAYPASDAQKKSISEALSKRLGRKISLECDVDASLVGGAIIRAGDMVIDGSVVGHLGKLTNALVH